MRANQEADRRSKFAGNISQQHLPLIVLAAGVAIRIALWTKPGYPGDIEAFFVWSRQIITQGFPSVYSLSSPAVNYSPVVMTVLAVIGYWYRTFISPEFAITQLGQFTLAIKVVFGSFDVGIAILGYHFIKRIRDPKRATLVLTLLALNPVLFLNSSYWGNLDSLHTLWIVLGLISLSQKRWGQGWVCLALAALSKPPALSLLPLAAIYTLWAGGVRGSIRGAIAATATALPIYLPFVLVGQWAVFTAPARSFELFPIWSANAHNLWWLVSGARGWDFSANATLGGVLPISMLGVALFSATYLYGIIYLRRKFEMESLWETAAFVAFCSFITLMGLHENHTYMVITLLAISVGLNIRLLPIMLVLSCTSTFNILAHDPSLLLVLHTTGANLAVFTWINALINVTTIPWWVLRQRSLINPLHRSATFD